MSTELKSVEVKSTELVDPVNVFITDNPTITNATHSGYDVYNVLDGNYPRELFTNKLFTCSGRANVHVIFLEYVPTIDFLFYFAARARFVTVLFNRKYHYDGRGMPSNIQFVPVYDY
jgi:hypothetical protein